MGRPPIGKAAMTGAERVRRYRLRHGTGKPVTKPAAPVTKPASPDQAALAQELAQAKAHIASLEKATQAKGGAARQDEIDALRAEVILLKTVLQAWRGAIEARTGVFTLAEFTKILACLHPDSRHSASDKKLGEAFRAFNVRKLALVPEAELSTKEKINFTAKEMNIQRAWATEKRRAQRAAKQPAARPKPPRHLPTNTKTP